MKDSFRWKAVKSFIVVAIVFLCGYLLAEHHYVLKFQNEFEQAISATQENRNSISIETANKIISSYDLSTQVSTSLDIIAAGIAVFALFGGFLSIFNILTARELEEALSRAENANSRAEMAIENQQELTGARLLQDGLVYVSRHRTYYAAKAFEEVIKQVPDTIAALTARYELLSLYADIKNIPIDEYRLRKIREKFDELINALNQISDKKNPEVCRHLQGDAYFTLGCAYGRCASNYSPPNRNHINVAEWHLKMALNFDNGDVDYHRNLAYTYAMANKMNQCKRELEVAIDCAEREPLYKPLISSKRLRILFNPIWDTLSEEMHKMLNEIFMTL